MRRVKSEPSLLVNVTSSMPRVPSETSLPPRAKKVTMHRREFIMSMLDAAIPRPDISGAILDPPPEVTLKTIAVRHTKPSSDAQK